MPVHDKEGKVPPGSVVVLPVGQGLHGGLGSASLPPLDTAPTGHTLQTPGAAGSVPLPARHLITAPGRGTGERGICMDSEAGSWHGGHIGHDGGVQPALSFQAACI